MNTFLRSNFPFLQGAGCHTVCLVGGGGKTTTLYRLAEGEAQRQKKVLVTTSTHIMKPETGYAETPQQVLQLWAAGQPAVIGTPAEHGKLTCPPDALYRAVSPLADWVFCEADGARRLPCKVPNETEPVIVSGCELVLGVLGMDAIGQPLREVCFRWELAQARFGMSPDSPLTPSMAATLLTEEQGIFQYAGALPRLAVLNKCDTPRRLAAAKEIQKLLPIPCVCSVYGRPVL